MECHFFLLASEVLAARARPLLVSSELLWIFKLVFCLELVHIALVLKQTERAARRHSTRETSWCAPGRVRGSKQLGERALLEPESSALPMRVSRGHSASCGAPATSPSLAAAARFSLSSPCAHCALQSQRGTKSLRRSSNPMAPAQRALALLLLVGAAGAVAAQEFMDGRAT